MVSLARSLGAVYGDEAVRGRGGRTCLMRSNGVGSRARLWLLAALCGGCYADSPLDPTPQVPLDSRLLGTWNCVTASPDSPEAATATLTAAPATEREYRLTWKEPEKEPESYRAFISSVRDATFLNVRPVEENEYTGWAFLRFSLPRATIISVEGARAALYQDKRSSASAAAARATLEKALESGPGALQDFCVCIRPEGGEPEGGNE
jgi:hypothetical protein